MTVPVAIFVATDITNGGPTVKRNRYTVNPAFFMTKYKQFTLCRFYIPAVKDAAYPASFSVTFFQVPLTQFLAQDFTHGAFGQFIDKFY